MSDIIPEGILYGNLGVGSGTTNYNDLDNKPQINSVTLQGNKTASELGLVGTSDIPVTSVNGETGAVVLDGTDIEYSEGVSLNEKIIAVEQEIPVIAYPVTSVNGETGAVVLDGTDIEYSSGVSVNSQIDTLMNYIPVYNNTASGAIATFDTSLALPLQDCTIEINAVQESGTPTPSSPKLISGFTGANIHVADDETPHIIDNVTAITWQDEAGTVYGGSLDVTSGVLTVTWAGMLLNTVTPTYNSTYGFFAYYNTQLAEERKTLGGINCECYDVYSTAIASTSQIASLPDKTIYYQGNNGHIFIKDTDYTDATIFINNVGTNKIIYELATPVTYQLTPTQISAIVGTNNIFTDTNGDTSVVYACSLKDYIDGQ